LEHAHAHRHVWLATDDTLDANVGLVHDEAQFLFLLQLHLVLVLRSHIFVLKTRILAGKTFKEFALEPQRFMIFVNAANGDGGELLCKLLLSHPDVVMVISFQVVIELVGEVSGPLGRPFREGALPGKKLLGLL